MAGSKTKSKTVDITTGIGILCFPHLTKSAAANNLNDKGEPRYDIQILIPKANREDAKALYAAIKEVGEAKWGDRWKSVRHPLRDGDKEFDDMTEDGQTKGEKYPERKGHYFINARSSKPVGVVDRHRNVIEDIDAEIYGGCKGRISIGFYTYSSNGNTGIGAGLNGVQKVADGEPFGGGRPSVESMFDMLDDADFEDEFSDSADELDEPEEKPAKKAAAKKAPAKKAAAKKKAAPVEDLDDADDQSDLDEFDDLDG